MKILARHKWVLGAIITESYDEKKEGYKGVSYRRFTATIRGFQGWKIHQGYYRDGITKEVIAIVTWIRDEIDKGNEDIFKIKGYFINDNLKRRERK